MIAAHQKDPNQPDYGESKFYRGLGSPLDAVQQALTAATTKRTRDEADIVKQRAKVAELKKPGGPKPQR